LYAAEGIRLHESLVMNGPPNSRWRGPLCVDCLAPRAREDSVRPRGLSGVIVRPLNFTVRRMAAFDAVP
jgi:hypothetical protein